jgi:oligopeptide/dipeptide ABC transporter ATP-binding protein
MIADEPTTALDVTIEAQILKLMKGMQAASNTSIILITHNLGIIAELCSYVYVMYAGQIMEQAPVFELFAEPKHPYTQGLLKSLPMLGEHREKLHAIPGSVPNLASLPPGCSFCPRCDIATSACYTLKPGLEKISEARKARCLLYSKGVAL